MAVSFEALNTRLRGIPAQKLTNFYVFPSNFIKFVTQFHAMRRFSIILSTSLAFFMLAATLVFNACTKDPCKDLICKNSGICRDGRCRCALGFEGPYCETKMYEKFIGTWDGTYRCDGLLPEVVTLIIAPEAQANRISIYNLFAQNKAIYATVDVDKVEIEAQTIDNITYRGHGYIDGKYMTLYVEEKNNSNGNLLSCVYNGTKFVNP